MKESIKYKKFILKVLLSLVIFFSSNYIHATCIIIYIGQNEITIGADSRNVRKGTASDSLEFLNTCKIKRFGSFFCAMSGFTNSNYYEFNPYNIVNKYLEDGKGLNSVKENIKADLKNELSSILKKIKTNKKSWEMIITTDNRILNLAIIGEIDKEFAVYLLGFVLSNPETMEIELTEEIVISDANTNKYIGFGESKAAKTYLLNHLNTDTPENLIKNAINEQKKESIIFVGGPVNILKIYKDRYQWIDNNNCGE